MKSTMFMDNVEYPSLRQTSTFLSPNRIIFGAGSCSSVAKEIRYLGRSRPLVVTYRKVQMADGLRKVTKVLESDGIGFGLYSEAQPEPSVEEAENLAHFTRAGNFDLIIGIGGGSVMDLAKIASLSVTNPGRIADYVGVDLVSNKGAPLICMPTTAGTGSEVTIFSVLGLGARKVFLESRYILPDIAIVDPALSATMPPALTAGTGMDALSQAIEAITSLAATPLTDALGLTAVELIGRWLRLAYIDGSNLEARTGMTIAATLSGLAFGSARLTLGHSLAQTFGPLKKISHGVSCGAALPYVMEFYLPVIPEKLSLVARALGASTGRISAREAGAEAIRAVRRLTDDLKIPSSLRRLGFHKSELPDLAERCVREWPRPNSPRELTTQLVQEVLERMYEGKILV